MWHYTVTVQPLQHITYGSNLTTKLNRLIKQVALIFSADLFYSTDIMIIMIMIMISQVGR